MLSRRSSGLSCKRLYTSTGKGRGSQSYPFRRGPGVRAMLRTGFILLALLGLCLLAACGPKDKRVVFVSERGGDQAVYTMGSDGSEVSSVPSGGDEALAPAWSPTRDHVALLSVDGDSSRLHILTQDGEEWDSCTIDEEQVLHFSWDPKGERVAFLAGTVDEADIFFTDVDCANVGRLTYSSAPMTLGNWSEDGQWVVYSITGGSDQGVFLRNPTGVDRKRVDDKTTGHLSFAPKGDALAFTTLEEDDRNARIWLVEDVHQPAPVSITNQAAPGSTFAWSPDGKRIVYVSDRDGDPEIYVMKANGSDQQQLTRNEIADTLPSWSSNGKRIIFVSDLHGNTEIFTMKDDGTDQQRLTNNDYSDTQPRW